LKHEIHKYAILPANGIESAPPEMCTGCRFQYFLFPKP